MRNLSVIGRIFYGIAIIALGFLTIFHNDFPYFLLPGRHSWLTSHLLIVHIAGFLLILFGTYIVIGKKTLPASLLLGTALLLIGCFYFIPYQMMSSARYMRFGAWENAAKELALAAGAFVIASCYAGKREGTLLSVLSKLIPLGVILYALTIISFSIDHFLYAKEAAGYVPSWIPYPVFWLYFTGSCLFGAGIAILLKIKPRLFATLLGTMILIWFIILHIPKSIAAPLGDQGGEVSSAFLALAYSGIAFVIAGNAKKR